MRICKEKSTGLIIDIQERLFPFISGREEVEKRTLKLIKGLKALGIHLMVTEQYVKGLGPTVPVIAQELEGIHRIEKMSFSCCDEPRFMENLSLSGKQNIIIAGIESHVCVMQTVVDLVRHAYQPVVVADCISSRNESDKAMAIERMRAEGAIITTLESILFELCRFSGNDTFKTISALVK